MSDDNVVSLFRRGNSEDTKTVLPEDEHIAEVHLYETPEGGYSVYSRGPYMDMPNGKEVLFNHLMRYLASLGKELDDPLLLNIYIRKSSRVTTQADTGAVCNVENDAWFLNRLEDVKSLIKEYQTEGQEVSLGKRE